MTKEKRQQYFREHRAAVRVANILAKMTPDRRLAVCGAALQRSVRLDAKEQVPESRAVPVAAAPSRTPKEYEREQLEQWYEHLQDEHWRLRKQEEALQ
jgi:hypothetical protein